MVRAPSRASAQRGAARRKPPAAAPSWSRRSPARRSRTWRPRPTRPTGCPPSGRRRCSHEDRLGEVDVPAWHDPHGGSPADMPASRWWSYRQGHPAQGGGLARGEYTRDPGLTRATRARGRTDATMGACPSSCANLFRRMPRRSPPCMCRPGGRPTRVDGLSAALRAPAGKAETPGLPGVSCGARYWDRTSDLFRVREARYRCANRAQKGC